MDTLLKVAGIAIAGMALSVVLKKETQEMGMVLGLFVAVTILAMGLDVFRSILDFMGGMSSMTGLSSDTTLPVIKTAGIAILTKITADICRDAKESAIASSVETVGAMVGLYVVLPLFQALIELMNGLL